MDRLKDIRQYLQCVRRTSTVDVEETWQQRRKTAREGRRRDRCCTRSCLMANLLLILQLAALCLGLVLGAALTLARSDPYTEQMLLYMRFPGEVLLNVLNLLTLPLVVSSLVSGLTSVMDTALLTRLGLRLLAFYAATTVITSVLTVVVAGLTLQYGNCHPEDPSRIKESGYLPQSIMDEMTNLIRELLPSNIVEAAFRKVLIVFKEKRTQKNATLFQEGVELEAVRTVRDGTNMLGIIFISVVFGLAVNQMESRALPLKILFDSLYDVTSVFVHLVVWYTPVGVLFLVMRDVVAIGDWDLALRQSSYMLAVVLGQTVYAFLVLPVLYFAVCRENPLTVVRGIPQALIIAFATSSSMTTLPITMVNLEDENEVDPRVVQLVAPIGAVAGLPVRVLMGPVAVVTIGCVEKSMKLLTSGAVIILGILVNVAALLSIGRTEADIAMTSLLLRSVGSPVSDVGIIRPYHWLLGRFSAIVSVLNDAYCAGIVHHLCVSHLENYDFEMKEEEQLHMSDDWSAMSTQSKLSDNEFPERFVQGNELFFSNEFDAGTKTGQRTRSILTEQTDLG